jgi:hypothetical protein
MKIEGNLVIPEAKLEYMLTRFDKANYLSRAGFFLQNPEALRAAIEQLVRTADAIEEDTNEYGTSYVVTGPLYGPNGIVGIVTVWITRDSEQYRFVTLRPMR